jgi:hypothetical protein
LSVSESFCPGEDLQFKDIRAFISKPMDKISGRHFREGGIPETSSVLDSRLRGNDGNPQY